MKRTHEQAMDRQRRWWRSQAGMTLLELMVAGFITVGVAAAGLAVLTATERAHTTNGQTVETQQNTRVAIELLGRDIRHAGFGAVGAVGNCASAVVPGDFNAAGPDTGSDRISLIVPVGKPVGSVTAPAWVLQNAVAPGFAVLTVPPDPAAPGDPILTDMQNQLDLPSVAALAGTTVTLEGVASRTVMAAGGSILILSPPNALQSTESFAANTPIYFLQCITYQVIPPPDPNNLCDGRAPCLVRGVAAALDAQGPNCNTLNSPCRPVADEIEDIQFAYACDGCNAAVNGGVRNDIIDDQPGGAVGFDQADFVTDSPWSVGIMTPDKIRLVQIWVVGRQRAADQGFGDATAQSRQSQPLQVSDHNHATGVFAAGDYAGLNPTYASTRRRVVSKTVEVRNLRS